MFSLKSLSREAIPAALSKVERYRLLNEPEEAESICRDVLAVEPAHQEANVWLILALSDQVDVRKGVFEEGLTAAGKLVSPYERAYYGGLLWERRAKARFRDGGPAACHAAFDFTCRAMKLFEQAERLRPIGNDDALLRWNACVRFLSNHPEIKPAPDDPSEPVMSE